jgi:putative holliday junction resolvase
MGRIMAIDVGQKRIGIAVTDPLRIIATGLATVPIAEVFRYLTEYTGKEKVDIFVVGAPVTMNNQPSQAVKFVEPFVKKLKKDFTDIPVRMMDERFTSGMAKKAIFDAGAGYMARRNKAKVDMVSAVILLQSFIDKENIEKL